MKTKSELLPIIIFGCVAAVCGAAGGGQSSDKKKANLERDFAIEGSEVMSSAITQQMSVLSNYESNLTEYANFRDSYFDNLTKNFGKNYKGSCGYVALGMFLSYYDTYFDDSLIPEAFDIASVGSEKVFYTRRNSPGILNDVITSSTGSSTSYGYQLSAQDYYNTIVSYRNVSLHADLICRGAQLGYYDFADNENPCGTTFDSRLAVLKDYLSDNGFSEQQGDYSFDYLVGVDDSDESSNAVRSYTIQKIQQGYPVLLSIGNISSGHVVVAYDYDSSTDSVYCHMGWGVSSTHKTPEIYNLPIYRTALVMNFNGAHVHSNNYGVTTVVNGAPVTNYYCHDDNQIHSYTNHLYRHHYSFGGVKKHKAYCVCGDCILEDHVSNGKEWTRNGHTYTSCVYCGIAMEVGSTPIFAAAPVTLTLNEEAGICPDC